MIKGTMAEAMPRSAYAEPLPPRDLARFTKARETGEGCGAYGQAMTATTMAVTNA
jgi:hypothetical protein